MARLDHKELKMPRDYGICRKMTFENDGCRPHKASGITTSDIQANEALLDRCKQLVVDPDVAGINLDARAHRC
jgi:hypothetical protein